MVDPILAGLASIIGIGVAAQWLAWRLRLPSILLLLVAGFAAGPLTGLLDPDSLLGDLLLPVVSLSVALILFEGGLTLRFEDIRGHGRVVTNLVTLGVVVTWVLASLAGILVAGLPVGLALLLGAILVVTGPTVIGPLVRHVRPRGRSGPILQWEGILNDAIGAILAVLVFEAILVTGTAAGATQLVALGIARALGSAALAGVAAAALLVLVLRKRWLPDHLQNPVTVALVIAVSTLSNALQEESGLLAVTLMGVVLANQRYVTVRHILEFKENLRVLLIAGLFVLLAARVDGADLARLGWPAALFLAALVLVVRPLVVLLSARGSALTWRERAFLSWMAPRGVVAAAVASLFALRLEDAGVPQAERLVPLAFLVIAGTVALYGLTAAPVARVLGLADAAPQGALIVGADPLARHVGAALRDAGVRALLVDSNEAHVDAARREDLDAVHGNALSEDLLEELDLSGVGRLLALTPNAEVNALAALHFADAFERADVYQLPLEGAATREGGGLGRHLRGRILFGDDATYGELRRRLSEGDRIERMPLGDAARLPSLPSVSGKGGMPLFVLRAGGGLDVVTASRRLTPKRGDTLLYLGAPWGDGDGE